MAGGLPSLAAATLGAGLRAGAVSTNDVRAQMDIEQFM